ncbi:conjugal transfer protein TraF [Marinomonas sp. GJ51-6]|uniref:conjugal transfer protein TraF n=1 Tax=Marinomonas sp. GJ51-6 TaxID=2992802 RepID=UPI0029347C40|nr:conjugal transfer protein TraF [Marinomonas sp. GJ51-6]WOD06424.1 conjugal transfer protein TraF [Marinomonas sp. GJ51-6]
MKKYLVLTCLSLFSSVGWASMYLYQPIGSSIVLGGYGNRHALSTASGNPASSYLMANLEGFRVGFLGSLGISVEGGGVDGVNDKVDDLVDILEDDFVSTLDNFVTATAQVGQDEIDNGGTAQDAEDAMNAYIVANVDTTVDSLETSLDTASDSVADIADPIYAKFATTLQAPFTPIIYKTRRRNVFTLEGSASIVGRASILAGDIALSGLDDVRTATDYADLETKVDNLGDIETDTSAYIKRASDYRFSIGYSTMHSRTPTEAILIGGRLNFHRLALGQKLTVLTEEDDPSVSYGDFFISRDKISTGISLDLGALLVRRNFQLGMTLSNVNEPTFKYEEIGNCSGLTGADLTNCNAAVSFASSGDIDLNETYKMEAQMTIDAAIKSKDQHISLGGSYDVNPIKDPLGDEYQWSVVSLSFFSDYLLIPGIRAGIRQNLVGNELTYYTAGMTLSRRLDIDLAYAPENDSGNSGLFFSMGYSFVF